MKIQRYLSSKRTRGQANNCVTMRPEQVKRLAKEWEKKELRNRF